MTIQQNLLPDGRRRLILSHSYRMTWNQCHKKAYWVGVQRLRPEVEPDYFARGTLGHELVDSWTKDPDRDRAAARILAQVQHVDPDLANGLTAYFGRNHPDPEGVVYKASRGPFSKVLHGPWPHEWEVLYTGDCDGIASWNSADWIVERKFGKQIPSDVVARFQLDDQIRGYGWYYRERFPKIAGAMVEVTRCTKNGDAVRDWVILEPRHFEEFEHDLRQTAEEIIAAYMNNRWPMSPHSCYAWGECAFRRLCLNTDRSMFATQLGYKIEDVTHEEKTLARLASDDHHRAIPAISIDTSSAGSSTC